MTKDYESERKQVWVQAWCMTAQSNSCIHPDVATNYADNCLTEYDDRFGPCIKEANDVIK